MGPPGPPFEFLMLTDQVVEIEASAMKLVFPTRLGEVEVKHANASVIPVVGLLEILQLESRESVLDPIHHVRLDVVAQIFKVVQRKRFTSLSTPICFLFPIQQLFIQRMTTRVEPQALLETKRREILALVVGKQRMSLLRS